MNEIVKGEKVTSFAPLQVQPFLCYRVKWLFLSVKTKILLILWEEKVCELQISSCNDAVVLYGWFHLRLLCWLTDSWSLEKWKLSPSPTSPHVAHLLAHLTSGRHLDGILVCCGPQCSCFCFETINFETFSPTTFSLRQNTHHLWEGDRLILCFLSAWIGVMSVLLLNCWVDFDEMNDKFKTMCACCQHFCISSVRLELLPLMGNTSLGQVLFFPRTCFFLC